MQSSGIEISYNHITFRNETEHIDNFIHLLHCVPKYFDEDEQEIRIVLDETVQFILKMFDTFHKHTTALKHHILQHRLSCDENDYKNLEEICKIIQKLENDSKKELKSNQKVLINFQRASDLMELKGNKKLQYVHKAVSITCSYVDAVRNIETYLYTSKSFWKDIISWCSGLLRDTAAKSLIKIDYLTENSQSNIDILNLKRIQKSTTFKIKAKEFCARCGAFIDECSLTDEKVTKAKENILKL